jgi:hypothetical protein
MIYILKFEHLEYQGGSGYDSMSGMHYSPSPFWIPQSKYYGEIEPANKDFDFYSGNTSYYRNVELFEVTDFTKIR